MGSKLLWTGLTFVIALTPVLALLGLNVDAVWKTLGAVIMVIGLILLWLGK